jgi:hypothetical protein
MPPSWHGAPIAYQVHLFVVSALHVASSVSALQGSWVVVVPPALPGSDDPDPAPPPEMTVPSETTTPQPQSHAQGGQSAPWGQ